VPVTPAATLTRARKIALSKGLHYVYTGNVNDATGGSTYCPDCGEQVIERDWYKIGRWHLDEHGQCVSYGQGIAGAFDRHAGYWGAKRIPVRLSSSPKAP
jgi:pyruvate formate lyase activating enzyme